MIRDDKLGTYQPMLFFNDFWLLRTDLIPINNGSRDGSHIKDGILMDQSLAMQQSMGASENDADEFKVTFVFLLLFFFKFICLLSCEQKTQRMLIETNPYLLGLTFAVTLLHSIFDFLAFKNGTPFFCFVFNFVGYL